MRLFLASTLAQGRKVFRDTFNRADVSGIGIASDGSAWNTIRGSWSILSNKAKAADSNYPLISQTMNTNNNQVELYGTSTGSAAALWVTDSGNWWAVGLTQEPTDCNCTYYYNSYYYYTTTNCPAYNVGTWNNVQCSGGYQDITVCSVYGQTCTGTWNASTCNNYAYNATGYVRCSGSWNTNNCNQLGLVCVVWGTANQCASYSPSTQNSGTLYFYQCSQQSIGYDGPYSSCQTCYPQYIRVIQSVANTVSTITQWSIASLASALKVKTSGSQLTISAYSDADMVSQIGSDLVYTPTGVTITPNFGITIVPSSYNQGYTVDEIQIKRN